MGIHPDIIFANDKIKHSELISSINAIGTTRIFFIDESENKMKIIENTTHKMMSVQKIFN